MNNNKIYEKFTMGDYKGIQPDYEIKSEFQKARQIDLSSYDLDKYAERRKPIINQLTDYLLVTFGVMIYFLYYYFFEKENTIEKKELIWFVMFSYGMPIWASLIKEKVDNKIVAYATMLIICFTIYFCGIFLLKLF